MEKSSISKLFLIFLIIAVVYACYRIFEPFLDEILAATILVTIFYAPYQGLVKIFRGRKSLASLVMCILVALVVILPLVNFIVYASQRSVAGYERTIAFFSENKIDGIVRSRHMAKLNALGLSSETVRDVVVDMAKKVNDWLVSGAGNFIKGTTNFFISMILIIFTMFFFFIDGKRMVEKLMFWTPLPNKYDKEIFKKFRDVSFSTMISTFATAIAQGLVGAIGFAIIGLPALFAGIAMSLFSLIPYIGAGFIWFPVSVYLLIVGKIWQGIFLLAWGLAAVSMVDNLVRAYVIKGKAQVHPIFVIFSILGGIVLFGFWGVIFGPLIISLAVTVLHIYELEYESVLER